MLPDVVLRCTFAEFRARIIHERLSLVVGEGAPRGGLFRDAVNTSLYALCRTSLSGTALNSPPRGIPPPPAPVPFMNSPRAIGTHRSIR